MLSLSLSSVRRVLCLGAHADDIEIGAGGTLLKLIEGNPNLKVCWVVFSAPLARYGEAMDSAKEYLAPLKNPRIKICSFRESYFPSQWEEIKNTFTEISSDFLNDCGGLQPDLIFTHFREDRHQDHRVLSDLTWNAFRNNLILEYEILKYDGDLGQPNVFLPLSEKIATRKIELLFKHFKSQASSKHWFNGDSFKALHRIRGLECASLYAEAFYARKMTLSTSINSRVTLSKTRTLTPDETAALAAATDEV
jgi:LmbE family N-acetylglucosaminyl deacetylase